MKKVELTLEQFARKNRWLEKIWRTEFCVPHNLDMTEKNYFYLDRGGEMSFALAIPRESLVLNHGAIFNGFIEDVGQIAPVLGLNGARCVTDVAFGEFISGVKDGRNDCFMVSDPQVATDVLVIIDPSYPGLPTTYLADKYKAKFFKRCSSPFRRDSKLDVWVLPKTGFLWLLGETIARQIKDKTSDIDKDLAEYNANRAKYREFIKETYLPEVGKYEGSNVMFIEGPKYDLVVTNIIKPKRDATESPFEVEVMRVCTAENIYQIAVCEFSNIRRRRRPKQTEMTLTDFLGNTK